MQDPLAIKAKGRGSSGHPAEPLDVLDLQVRPVDGLLVIGASRHQDRHQDVVVGVAHVVARRLLTDHEALHVDGGHEVGRAEDDRLDALARGRDGVDVGQTERVLDLGLDANPADLKSGGLLDLGQQQVERDNLLRRLDLGQHDGVEVGASALDDLDDIGIRPLRRPVVDPDGTDGLSPAALIEARDDVLACVWLGQRCHGVLDVQEDLVGAQAPGLVDHLDAGTGNRKV